jgi:hypothetical protein
MKLTGSAAHAAELLERLAAVDRSRGDGTEGGVRTSVVVRRRRGHHGPGHRVARGAEGRAPRAGALSAGGEGAGFRRGSLRFHRADATGKRHRGRGDGVSAHR